MLRVVIQDYYKAIIRIVGFRFLNPTYRLVRLKRQFIRPRQPLQYPLDFLLAFGNYFRQLFNQ